MSNSRRCSQAGGRTRQYYGGADLRPARALIALVLFSYSLNAASLLHIRVLEGEGAVHTAGGRTTRGLTVEITDETGRPVDGAAVSFRLPEEGPGGTFAHGMRTEILMTGPDGRAGFREFVAGRTVGPFQVRVTAVRESVRAGTVVDQYISEATRASARGQKLLSSSGGGEGSGISKKWIVWLAIGGAAVAAGVVAGASGGGAAASAAPPSAPVVVAPPTVGTPVIVIGRPQ